jgi:hypothetical protein
VRRGVERQKFIGDHRKDHVPHSGPSFRYADLEGFSEHHEADRGTPHISGQATGNGWNPILLPATRDAAAADRPSYPWTRSCRNRHQLTGW